MNNGLVRFCLFSIASLFFLTGCASTTNGWDYPTDCCFHQQARCGSYCVKPVCHKVKVRVCQSPDHCGPASMCQPIEYNYQYPMSGGNDRCCVSRNYWVE